MNNIFFLFIAAIVLNIFPVLTSFSETKSFEPTTEIQNLEKALKLSEGAKALFYATQPKIISDKKIFKSLCLAEDESTEKVGIGKDTSILGCFIPKTESIYIYNPGDSRISGVKENSAAHELLHAAYLKLNNKEKESVDALIEHFFSKSADEKLRQRIVSFSKERRLNELHSILGTETLKLPPELELHYSKYFVDRKSVVSFSRSFDNELDNRKTKIKELDNELEIKKAQIESNKKVIGEISTEVNAEKSRIESIRGNQEPKKINKAIDEVNTKISKMNKLIRETDVLINQYNRIVIQRNSYSKDTSGLIKKIDTRTMKEEK